MSRYEWKERIATGGMGEVWRAEDTVLGREVAVKVLKPELADDPRFRERFSNEARNAASLHHPNIASVFDFGESAGDPPRPFLVMELVRGRPLSDLLQPGRPMPPDQARHVVRQAAEALAAAHAVGMVHRDVKPANILVTPDGTVKVTDFGIARAADAVALTGTGEMIGTPHYISPEQAEGRTASPASDVYALGVVLYELLAGSRPFNADTPVLTALAHVRSTPPELPPGVPADLAEVTRKAMSKDPAARYPDAGAMARALGASAGSLPVMPVAAAVPPPPPDDATQVLAPVAAVGPQPTQTRAVHPVDLAAYDEPQEKRSGPPSWWPVAAVLAIAVVIAAVYFLTRGSGDAQPTDPATTPVPSASDTPSPSQSAADTAEINSADYVGLSEGTARERLGQAGFDSVSTRTRTNPGSENAGDVAAISPSGTVRTSSTITLTVWGEPDKSPKPAPTPTPTPSKTPSPSSSPSSSPSPSQSPAAVNSASATP